MTIKTKTLKSALLGTILTAVGAMTSCCGPAPDPVAPAQPVVIKPMK